jgi:hemoglobin-like flavoprotein
MKHVRIRRHRAEIFLIAADCDETYLENLRRISKEMSDTVKKTWDMADKALGARHSGYGVSEAHYAIVGEALLWTLDRSLGEGFTPEVRSAWAKVYGVIAATMQAGATEVADLRAAE